LLVQPAARPPSKIAEAHVSRGELREAHSRFDGILAPPKTAECLGPYSALFTGEWNLFHRSIISENGVARASAPGWLEKVIGLAFVTFPGHHPKRRQLQHLLWIGGP
jgi:hypothetical protein